MYTYEFELEKKDGNGQPLEGAGFTLYKVVTQSFAGAKTGAAIKGTLAEDVNASKLVDDKYYVPVTMTASKDSTSGKVTHKTDTSIDSGSYVLIETTVPAGYNAYAGDDVIVTSTISDTGELTNLSASGHSNISADKGTGLITTQVVNQSGTQLPSTGGIGTTIFYIVGSLLVIGCGIVLVSRRRMNNK